MPIEASPAPAPEAEAEAETPEAGSQSDAAAIVAEFARLADSLDAAGLGPADYLYAPLKWRLEHRDTTGRSVRALAGRAWRHVAEPPPLPDDSGQAAILFASSYSVSADFLRKVRLAFDPAEAVLCDASNGASASLTRRLRTLAALLPASVFALRVNRALKHAGASTVERRRIAEAALTHRVYRLAARSVLRQAKPECVVIANGNRPFEFALFAEAKARGLRTVLLPFAELNPKPARFLSLCRGDFDLALPFSEHSAEELRKLRKGGAVEVVGFPHGGGGDPDGAGQGNSGQSCDVLYICGNNFEEEAAALLREAFAAMPELRLWVRLHPRNDTVAMRKQFSFVPPERVSEPDGTPLAGGLAKADLVVMVRSTVGLDAMFAGKPLIWLSPPEHRAAFDDHPIRKQKLALHDASTAEELRAIVLKLAADPQKRRRVAEEQWSRLNAAGYRPGYYDSVRAALRRLVDWGQRPGSVLPPTSAAKT